MEALHILWRRQVKALVVYEPIVIFAVDQVVRLMPYIILGQVEEISDAIRLFANEVAVSAALVISRQYAKFGKAGNPYSSFLSSSM